MPTRPLVVSLAIVLALASAATCALAQDMSSIPTGNGCRQVVPGGSDTPTALSLFTPVQQASLWLQATMSRGLRAMLALPTTARVEPRLPVKAVMPARAVRRAR